jgi:hypothetical protein
MKNRIKISFILILVLLIITNLVSVVYFSDKTKGKEEELVEAYNLVLSQEEELTALKDTEIKYKKLLEEHETLSRSQQALEKENKTLVDTYQELTAQFELLKTNSSELEQRLNDMDSIMRQYSYVFEYDPVTLEEYQVYIQELERKILDKGGLDKFEKPKRWKKYSDIVIWLEDGASVKWADEAISYLHLLPRNILDTLNEEGWMFILTPRSLEEVYESGVTNTVGLTVYYQTRIYIQNNSFSISYCTIHEVGHALDFIHNFVSYEHEWKLIFENEAKESGLASYFTSSSSEYFAETFQMFFLDSEALKEVAPQTYEYLSEFIDQYQ